MGTTKQDVGNRGLLVAERLVIDGRSDVLCFFFRSIEVGVGYWVDIFVLIEVGVGVEM